MRNDEITGVEAKRTQHVRGQAGSPASGRGVQAGKPCSWRRGRVVYGEDLLLTERLLVFTRRLLRTVPPRRVFTLPGQDEGGFALRKARAAFEIVGKTPCVPGHLVRGRVGYIQTPVFEPAAIAQAKNERK